MSTTQKIVPCLWFNGNAEAAAEFYVSLLPDSRIDRILKSPTDTPSVPAGMVLTVEFTLAGMQYMGLNGGSQFPFTEAVSFQIYCDDQPEVDRLWAAIAEGGSEIACGWVKDRWGVPWQIVPRRLIELINDPDVDRARRAQEAMMQMVKIDIATIERAADGIS
ncbi:VOC family protein [Leptolyngbya sp. NK1-12]|uniref:VOC family protein n=1 Tax=Leptolyngbya sp. NK1-12 TaxID=2547451 RepID=A0AA96WI95_9CYAN|nr:VOC family protein [Leptolyngbya sp. NK1-12]WNZ25828.1 VOC family protein [Leptolyngbya sp. NK1-12]